LAILAAYCTSLTEALVLYLIFYIIDLLNSAGYCETIPICRSSAEEEYNAELTPSNRTYPSSGR
jgi:hypothetical protein